MRKFSFQEVNELKAFLLKLMAGAAIIVSLQQLKSLLGITHFTTQMGLIPVLSSVFHKTNEVSALTLILFFLVIIINKSLYSF